jgi:hypothetical protein
MCIPILATMVGLSAFLGWAMMNQQNVKSAARYTAWRHTYGGWPSHHPTDPNRTQNPLDPNNPDDTSHPWLNAMFLSERADDIGVGGHDAGEEEFGLLAAAAGQYGTAPGRLAGDLVLDPCHWEHHRGSSVSANFPTSVPLWQQYKGAIRSGHARDGRQWRRGQADCVTQVRDQFLDPLDRGLLGLPAPADGLGQMVRGLYMGGW